MNKPDWIRYFNSELSFGDFPWHIFVFSAGKRLFKQWLCAPLCNPASINDRSGVAYSRLSRSVEKSWIAGGRKCITSVCFDNHLVLHAGDPLVSTDRESLEHTRLLQPVQSVIFPFSEKWRCGVMGRQVRESDKEFYKICERDFWARCSMNLFENSLRHLMNLLEKYFS